MAIIYNSEIHIEFKLSSHSEPPNTLLLPTQTSKHVWTWQGKDCRQEVCQQVNQGRPAGVHCCTLLLHMFGYLSGLGINKVQQILDAMPEYTLINLPFTVAKCHGHAPHDRYMIDKTTGHRLGPERSISICQALPPPMRNLTSLPQCSSPWAALRGT
jgi:hypothetical protein